MVAVVVAVIAVLKQRHSRQNSSKALEKERTVTGGEGILKC